MKDYTTPFIITLTLTTIINGFVFYGSLPTYYYDILGVKSYFLYVMMTFYLIWFFLFPFMAFLRFHENYIIFGDDNQELVITASSRPIYKKLNKLLLLSEISHTNYSFRVSFGRKKRRELEKDGEYRIKFKKSSEIKIKPLDIIDDIQNWVPNNEPYLECKYNMEKNIFLSLNISTKISTHGNIDSDLRILFEYDGKKTILKEENIEII